MSRNKLLITMGLLITLAGLGIESATAPAAPGGTPNPSPQTLPTAPGVLRAEANLVLVDVIATDKKGNYIKDLEKKDFHVFEDSAEQPISSFSRESDIEPNAPGHQRYMVLFFDDSTMSPALQTQARQAAGKFVESTASSNRMMAVVDFDGTLRVYQNFTADGELLKRAVSNVKYASLNPNSGSGGGQLASLGAPILENSQAEFAQRSVLLSIRDIAKSLRSVAGRKSLIFFSSGFPLTPEIESELTATVDALNKANIAVYPVDVRGLAVTAIPGTPSTLPGFPPSSELRGPESPFDHLPGLWAALAAPPDPVPQHGGGGGGGGGRGGSGGTAGGGSGGSRGGGGTTGSTGSTGTGSSAGTKGGTGSGSSSGGRGATSGSSTYNPYNSNLSCLNANTPGGIPNPNCPNRQIIPTIPNSVTTNQQVLYALAKGTGGFEIFNTNDFLSGLEKVSREINEYYNLGYASPNQTHDGTYHKITVKVERRGVDLRFRTGYFDVKSPDLLKDKPEGKALEDRVASAQPGDFPVSLNAPYFYIEPGVARVNMALSVPGSSIDFEKQKGLFHSDVNVLGIAYRENGSVAARFSDTVKLDYEKKEVKELAKGSFDYQNNFSIAPGSYTLKLVLSAGGQKFGKYAAPLVIEPFSGDALTVGGPALGKRYAPVSQLSANMDAALLEDRVPLVVKGLEFVPAASYNFAKDDQPVVYLEVYDPALKGSNPPRVGIVFNIINRKTKEAVVSSPTILIDDYSQLGNPLIPMGLKLPIGQLQAGDYRFEIKGLDERGSVSTPRGADFTVQ